MDKKYNVGYKGRDKEITMRTTDIYTYCIMGEEEKISRFCLKAMN